MSESAVSVRDVWKSFDGREAVLKGINLEIPKGKLTAIIGFSGTGKSVILKHILGLYQPDRGVVEVLGQDMSKIDGYELTHFRKKFGVLFQSSALFDDMTVLENVCFPLLEHRKNISEAEMVKIASERLREVGLDQIHFEKLPSQISGGMQKRTGLARALALDPEILFYDEPTTGLDPILTEMVDDLILETHRDKAGMTSIMISHDLHAAFRIADFVAMLHAGTVLLSGPPKVFFESKDKLIQEFLQKGMKRS